MVARHSLFTLTAHNLSNQTWKGQDGGSLEAGQVLQVLPGTGGFSGASGLPGGQIYAFGGTGGNGASTNGAGGSVNLFGGSSGSGAGTGGNGGAVSITGGSGSVASSFGGATLVKGGSPGNASSNTGASATLEGGRGGGQTYGPMGDGGDSFVRGGLGVNGGNGGHARIRGGSGTVNGDVIIGDSTTVKIIAHVAVHMPELGSDPSTATNQGALYTKDVGGTTQLFFRRDNNGAVTQLT